MFEYFVEHAPQATVTTYIEDQLGFTYGGQYIAIGLVKDGKLSGGIVFHGFTGDDIEITFAGKGMVTRRALHMMATVAFQDNAAARITCFTRPSNTMAQTTLQKIGFKLEGVRRKYYGDDDGLMYGLLKEECRW